MTKIRKKQVIRAAKKYARLAGVNEELAVMYYIDCELEKEQLQKQEVKK